MFKIYQSYIYKKFLLKYFYFNVVFLTLVIILGILEEISFFKNFNTDLTYPIILTFLNAPNTLFEILPFIFLLSTQFLFFELINKDELSLLKRNGLENHKLIRNLFFLGVFVGVFNVLIFYNLSAVMKFQYSSIKNNFSNDNKYLAMVTESGLWIKDNINENNLIIKSEKINDNFLYEVIINEFNKNFELVRVIKSKKIDISSTNWIIYNPEIIINNVKDISNHKINLITNFDMVKINSFFSDVSTLDIFNLYNSKKDYERLGYSSDEISIHLLKLTIMPVYYGILIVIASILMIKIKKINSIIFNLLAGIMISVSIYYLTFIFNAMGNSGKIPVEMSVFFPVLILTIISLIGIVRINER